MSFSWKSVWNICSGFICLNHCFYGQFLLSTWKLCLRYTAGNFNENASMRALAKILRARASEHLSNFCEQFEQRPNFASTFKLDGTIRYPSAWIFLKQSKRTIVVFWNISGVIWTENIWCAFRVKHLNWCGESSMLSKVSTTLSSLCKRNDVPYYTSLDCVMCDNERRLLDLHLHRWT